MKQQLITGISFGLTSAIIATLAIIVGLDTVTSSKMVVVTGIVMMAVGDGLADAMGIHLAEESKIRYTKKEIWLSTLFTFLSVSLFSLSFLIPILLLDTHFAILASLVWGMGLLTLLSYYLAKMQEKKPLRIILEHNLIAIIVVIITYYLGILIRNL